MRILICGAGWYGCYAALILQRRGIAFDLVDVKSSRPFAGSSAKNQNRLHLSFHYPRCARTRRECIEGFARFEREFSGLGFTNTVHRNLYMVARRHSLMDFDTYRGIFDHQHSEYTLVSKYEIPEIQPEAFDGEFAMEVDERHIDFARVRAYFERELPPVQRLDRAEILNRVLGRYKGGEYTSSSSDEDDGGDDAKTAAVATAANEYDLVLNCTYGAFLPFGLSARVEYELCCGWTYAYVGANEHPLSLIVMDGPFFSLFPFADGLTLMTHVRHTPLRRAPSVDALGEATAAEIDAARRRAEDDIVRFVPGFRANYRARGHLVSIKCKLADADGDDRSLHIEEHEAYGAARTITFIGGKITGIFAMQDYLERFLDDTRRK